ncbi:hypothetical protein [Alienimonas sp. DA493]|uniref:hypothetical protein n=1 Tax=Alienimonas sp. DA493 TaxID=3373605 RepID=UPI0037544C87
MPDVLRDILQAHLDDREDFIASVQVAYFTDRTGGVRHHHRTYYRPKLAAAVSEPDHRGTRVSIAVEVPEPPDIVRVAAPAAGAVRLYARHVSLALKDGRSFEVPNVVDLVPPASPGEKATVATHDGPLRVPNPDFDPPALSWSSIHSAEA